MNAFTIRELENLSGIKAHTIRIWEQRYSFLKPQRTDTNIRYYSADELKAVLNIALLSKYGFRISQIDKMSAEEIRRNVLALPYKEAQQARLVNELVQCTIDLDAGGFEELLDQYIQSKGISNAITQLVFPFLDKTGLLWITSDIAPAQEHLVSNIIRQKLIVGIEETQSKVQTDKKIVLFLPEGEYHELGLLYVYYLLKSRGVQVIYLGASVPLKDMELLLEKKRPDYFYAHLAGLSGQFSFDKFIQQLQQYLPQVPVVLSGQLPLTQKRQLPANIHLKRSLDAVLLFISSLQN